MACNSMVQKICLNIMYITKVVQVNVISEEKMGVWSRRSGIKLMGTIAETWCII